MARKLQINKDEIEKIISKYFGVELEDAHVDVRNEIVGYGMGEHTESVVVANIDVLCDLDDFNTLKEK